MTELHEKPGTPGDILHYGTKGMRWGVRKQEETEPVREAVTRNEEKKRQLAKDITKSNPVPGTPEFQKKVSELTSADRPQTIERGGSEKSEGTTKAEKHGLTRNQKMLITFGAVSAAAAGYYAYQHYTGNKMPGAGGLQKDVNLNPLKLPLPNVKVPFIGNLNPSKVETDLGALDKMKFPSHWDVSGLDDGPLSKKKLGKLGGGSVYAELLDKDNLVINTSRGYADILPKHGFDRAYAADQHASVTRVLEEMRDKYPRLRNMNIEVVPMSKVPGLEKHKSQMAVMGMRAGEARVMYNDMIDAPDAAALRRNRKFLPGLGKKDYLAYHEMGHLLALAHGDTKPSFDLLTGKATPEVAENWHRAGPLLHRKTFHKHGFSFRELSKISEYAGTQPSEAMAELFGHLSHPEMRARLTPDQITRATAMFDEMGGL